MTTAPTSARSSAHTTSRMGTWMSGRTERRPAGSSRPARRPRLASDLGQARLTEPHELQNPSHDKEDKPGHQHRCHSPHPADHDEHGGNHVAIWGTQLAVLIMVASIYRMARFAGRIYSRSLDRVGPRLSWMVALRLR